MQAHLLFFKRVGREPRLRHLPRLYDASERADYRVDAMYHVVPEYTSLVPAAEPEMRGEPLSTWSGFEPTAARIEFRDFTHDGIPEVALKLYTVANYSAYYIRIFSYADDGLSPLLQSASILSSSTVEYGDTDDDGLCQIMLPSRIRLPGFASAFAPENWITTYEWSGSGFVLDNRAHYLTDIESLAENLKDLVSISPQAAVVGYARASEAHDFQIGMVYYYQERWGPASSFLARVVKKGENEEYVAVARAVLEHTGRMPKELHGEIEWPS